MPHASSTKRRVAVMSLNDTHDLAEEAAKLGLDYVDTDTIVAFNKNKRKIKHWGTSPPPAAELRSTASLRTDSTVPRLMGPQLYKMRNAPFVLPEDTPLAARVEETLRTVKIYATSRRYRPDVAVGNVSMSAQELIDNVMACVRSMLAALLPSHDLLKAIQLHATRGPALTITPHPKRAGKGDPTRKVQDHV